MKFRPIIFLLVVLLTAIGCSNRTSVQGTVKYEDGEPVTFGVVKFVGPKIQATGNIQKNGKYVMDEFNPADGVTPGVYNIAIAGVFTGGGSDGKPVVWYIDEKFNNPSTSGLTCEVGKKSLVHDITVSRPASAKK